MTGWVCDCQPQEAHPSSRRPSRPNSAGHEYVFPSGSGRLGVLSPGCRRGRTTAIRTITQLTACCTFRTPHQEKPAVASAGNNGGITALHTLCTCTYRISLLPSRTSDDINSEVIQVPGRRHSALANTAFTFCLLSACT